jgi:asparagine synthase (glutamine-hydrolysing)
VCGIAGWVKPGAAPVEARAIVSMARALAHRGPDGEGIHVEPGCGLGHRRLALLDMRGGAQPMANEDETVWVVANNEIYNYIELRQALISRGHRLATAGDTEVLVHLYEELGPSCVEPLVGMYAFAVWDRRRRTLLLARDRFGIKPLYYAIDARGELRFASELRALLAVPGIDRTLDMPALREYLRHLTIPEPRTVYRSIRKLPAAHCLVWRDGSTHLARYWRLADRTEEGISETEATLELERQLLASTALSLRSDEPVGLFLSGGLDSSLLAWAMHSINAKPLRTFSVSFAEPQFDESAYSRAVAAAFGSEHHDIRVAQGDAVDAALRLVESLDEPFADSSALPTYILSREARRSVKAVLAGEGADELFGGNAWHYAGAAPAGAEDLVAPPAKVIFAPDLLDTLCSADTRAQLAADPYDPAAAFADDMPAGLDRLHRQLYADIAIYLPSDLLAKMDRMSMLNSLEVRVPYLNHPLAERVWALPTELKQRRGIRKLLLRKVAERRLPSAIVGRAKQGFAIPMDIWVWKVGRFRDAVYDTLRAPRCRQRGLFDGAIIETMLEEHHRLRQLHGHRLWALFVLEQWLRHAW